MLLRETDRVGVVTYDAGAASLLLCHMKFNDLFFKSYIKGPSKSIIPDGLKHFPCASIDELLSDIDVLMTGTSYPPGCEMEAVEKANLMGIKTISFVDSWLNYRVRFEYKNQTIIPDVVVLTDDLGFSKAERELFDFNVVRGENYYKKYLVDLYGADVESQPVDTETVLYLTEPTSSFAKKMYGDPKFWGYDEFEALDFFLDNLKRIGVKNKKIIIKVHPSEPIEKYKAYFEFAEVINTHKPEEFFLLLKQASIVVGCTTMALHVSTWLDKRVISSIPPGGTGFYLPRANIEFLSKI